MFLRPQQLGIDSPTGLAVRAVTLTGCTAGGIFFGLRDALWTRKEPLMSQPVDCVVAGHICLDVTPEIYPAGDSITDYFRPGKLLQVGPPTVSTGGPVSNTGLPLRRLGMNVQLMGKCGDDTFGHAIVDCIRREAPGAEAGMQITPGEQTSYTVVVNPPGIDRMFLHCTGANDTFGADDIGLDAVEAARLFHFGYPPLMARTYADGGKELAAIFQRAKQTGVTTSLDMAYPDPTGPAGQADWNAILRGTLPHVDIFTPSVEEITFMLRRESFDALSAKAGDRELLGFIDGDLLRDLGDQAIADGAAVVLIKCGYLGLYVRTAGPDRLAETGRGKPADLASWENREIFEPSYRVERIVSATGAGDCAIAAFLSSFLRGVSLDDTMRYACMAGAQNLSAADTISGIRPWEETVRQVAERPAKTDVDIPLEGFTYDEAAARYAGPADRGA
jgi:sugar/nucleoside kinase (ribokinase family)